MHSTHFIQPLIIAREWHMRVFVSHSFDGGIKLELTESTNLICCHSVEVWEQAVGFVSKQDIEMLGERRGLPVFSRLETAILIASRYLPKRSQLPRLITLHSAYNYMYNTEMANEGKKDRGQTKVASYLLPMPGY